MAQRGVQLEQERFCCSMCQRLLNDPVTIGCGHSFCRSCVKTHWDKEKKRGSFSCPQCGETFTSRPVLGRNTMLADLVEELERVQLHDAPERTERRRKLGLQQPESESESESEPEPEPEPKTRADFLRYSQKITLDPNTEHGCLKLSEGNRRVERMRDRRPYSNHQDRFTNTCQVLSSEPLNPRCYWEVEVKVTKAVGVAVTDNNISRAGNSDKCRFGFYDNSWMLRCNGNSYDYVDNSIKNPVSGPVSSRVGVYHREGVLKFYSVVSDTMTLLRRVDTESTDPLYAGVWLDGFGSTAKFCKLK